MRQVVQKLLIKIEIYIITVYKKERLIVEKTSGYIGIFVEMVNSSRQSKNLVVGLNVWNDRWLLNNITMRELLHGPLHING